MPLHTFLHVHVDATFHHSLVLWDINSIQDESMMHTIIDDRKVKQFRRNLTFTDVNEIFSDLLILPRVGKELF